MTVRSLRWVDRWLGIPLCHIAGFLARLAGTSTAELPGRWRTVLVIKCFGMGSILLSSSLLAGLRRLSPGARILFLTFDVNREIVQRFPEVADIVTIRTSGPLSLLSDITAALRRIRVAKPDVVFDLEYFSKFSSFVSLLSGAPVRVGYELPVRWRRTVLTHPIPLDRHRHARDVLMSQLGPFGSFVNEEHARLRATGEERSRVDVTLRPVGDRTPLVTVNMNAGPTALERRWPPERFVAAVRILADDLPDAVFCFTGSTGERAYVAGAIASDPRVAARSVNLAGQLSIGELVALLEKSDVFLTNDTGPMHLAGALGTATVALFGPESPDHYGPDGDVRIVYKALPCSPCLNVYNAKVVACPYNAACMSAIEVDEVVRAVHEALATQKVMVA
jgi:ADP-heptose:LPS heptosyltransferase